MWRLEAAADAVLALEAQTAADALRKAQAEVRRLEAIVVRLVGFTRRDDPSLRRLHGLRDAIRFPGDARAKRSATGTAALEPRPCRAPHRPRCRPPAGDAIEYYSPASRRPS